MNYTALSAAILQYTANYETTFVANVPLFVKIAEERIYNSVYIPAIRKNVTGSMTLGNKYLTMPSDYLAVFSVAVIDPVTNAQHYLIDKDVNFIRESFPDPDVTAKPTHYAVFDQNTLILGPTPNDSYAVELHYYYYPESIVTAGNTWLGDNFESVLLYGALREAYLFMKGEQDLIAYYDQKYTESLALLKKLGEGRNLRDAYRSGLPRTNIT